MNDGRKKLLSLIGALNKEHSGGESVYWEESSLSAKAARWKQEVEKNMPECGFMYPIVAKVRESRCLSGSTATKSGTPANDADGPEISKAKTTLKNSHNLAGWDQKGFQEGCESYHCLQSSFGTSRSTKESALPFWLIVAIRNCRTVSLHSQIHRSAAKQIETTFDV